jgi:hypothetical protein
MSSLSTGSWFDDEAVSLSGQLEEFGEWFDMQPYRVLQVNFPSGPDPSRQPYTFRGVFERDAKSLSLGMSETTVSTRRLCVTALVCDAPGIRQYDRLTHKLTGELFEVIDAKPDGLSGIELHLTQLGRQKQ